MGACEKCITIRRRREIRSGTRWPGADAISATLIKVYSHVV